MTSLISRPTLSLWALKSRRRTRPSQTMRVIAMFSYSGLPRGELATDSHFPDCSTVAAGVLESAILAASRRSAWRATVAAELRSR